MRGPVGIEGREYKLLLDPEPFPGAPSGKVAKSFWNRQLKPIIDERLDGKDAGETRAKGLLSLKKQRLVTFLDSRKRVLALRGFALRVRTAVEDGAPSGVPEVTLKFRTPDFLLAAEYCRAARKSAGETKLEEDIAPLQVARGKKPVVVAKPASIYSRYSVSTKLAFDGTFENLGDVFQRFGMLKDHLNGAKAEKSLKLLPGPTIFESVFQDAKVDLGEDLDAEFGFTLWYLAEGKSKADPFKRVMSGALDPRVAEISFDFDTKSGRLDATAAERAAKLFVAMQENLPVNAREASKTAVGLPSG